MSAEGNALILAKDNINFDVAHNTENQDQQNKASGWSVDNRSRLVAGTFKDKGYGNGATDTITGTQLSVGGTTSLSTLKGDITLTGSNLVSDGSLTINAANNLTLQSGQDTAGNANHSDNKAIGQVVISDTERFVGYHNEKHNDNDAQVTQVASNVSSLKGNVSLSAGDKYSQTASNVLAANDISISGKSLEITTADNTGARAQDNSDLKIGVFARVSSPIIDLINNIESARHSDTRMQAMQGLAALAEVKQISNAVQGKGALISVEAGVGFSTAKSEDKASYQVAQGSTIAGSGNVTLTSTQDDTVESEQGTITVTAASGSNEIDVSLRNQEYIGSANCAAATLNTDLTVSGRLTDKGTTKTYTDATGAPVTAKVATFAYSGVTFSKGSFSGSLPIAGTTTDIAYYLTGNDLYVSKGKRGADGLGDSLSKQVAVKQ